MCKNYTNSSYNVSNVFSSRALGITFFLHEKLISLMFMIFFKFKKNATSISLNSFPLRVCRESLFLHIISNFMLTNYPKKPFENVLSLLMFLRALIQIEQMHISFFILVSIRFSWVSFFIYVLFLSMLGS